MSSKVTIAATGNVFCIHHNGGVTCLGFDVTFKRLEQYRAKLNLAPPSEDEIGTVKQYHEYEEALAAYAATNPQETQYDVDTPRSIVNLLEMCRKSGTKVRIFYGDVKTGRSWMDEHDVIGRVSRSMGPLKTALLATNQSDFAGPILSACIVRVMNADSGFDLMRHPTFHVPELVVCPCEDTPGYAAMVTSKGDVMARFKTGASASNWVAFHQGNRMRA